MPRYALLLQPSANRVYAGVADRLAAAELAIVAAGPLAARVGEIASETIAGVGYLTFSADRELDLADRALLGGLSASYALFEVIAAAGRSIGMVAAGAAGAPWLRPVDIIAAVDAPARLDGDLVTIPKYPGKTNEQFTALLLNVTRCSARPPIVGAAADSRRPSLLDPLCGRGTTLSVGLRAGCDVTGIDLDGKDFEAYGAFLREWLRRKGRKHSVVVTRIRREHAVLGRKLEVTIGPDRHSTAAPLRLTYLNVDSTRAREFLRDGSIDLIVTDAPYGVQHGSRSAAAGMRRSPLELLTAAAPQWVALLRPGGTLGLAWNVRVAPREAVIAVLAGAGLAVLDDGPYRQFEHRVDASIQRDVVVARRPG